MENEEQSPRKSYDKVIDLLARGTIPAELLAFRPSEESRKRVQYLLARNRTDELTAYEAQELECFGEIAQFMQLVKARTRWYVINYLLSSPKSA